MQHMLNTAIKAVREASKHIIQAYDRLDTISVNEKARNDFVTNIDIACEQEIIEAIRQAYPQHSILAEESGKIDGSEDYTWVIDPLDGTTNFIHGFPHFAISVAMLHKGRIELGVVYDPMRQELFTTMRGRGAQLNQKRLRVSSRRRLDEALIGTGFPFKQPEYFKPYINTFQTLFPLTSGIRRAGAAALDLAYVAAGRLDGFWEMKLKPWDIMAGALLIQEAGGFISDFQGENRFLETGNVICGNPKIYKAIMESIQPCLEPQ